ncbi:hypothetical protein ACN38_g11680, partial [Penicillium nordicum]
VLYLDYNIHCPSKLYSRGPYRPKVPYNYYPDWAKSNPHNPPLSPTSD